MKDSALAVSAMKRPLAFILACATVFGLSFVVQGADKQIVIIAGRPSHGPGEHEFRAGALLLQKALAGVQGLNVQVISGGWPAKMVEGVAVDDPAALDQADAILLYSDGGGGNPAIQKDRIKVLDALAAKGVGLGFAHYAVEVPVGAPAEALHRWIGGYYETNYSVNPMWKPEFGPFPNHPVTRGVKPFGNLDEWYFNTRWTPDPSARARLTQILTSKPGDEVRKGPYVSPKGPYDHIIAGSGNVESMMWVYERANGGRGFGFTGGHTHTNWGDPNQRKIVLNALLWMAKMDVPAGGVADGIVAGDLEVNLDPKRR